jgi:periplasmic iron binding protein
MSPALARCGEFYVGDPMEQDNLEIVPNYLTGIEMDHMRKAAEMGPDVIHIEADVHATKGETHGFPEGARIPYLTIHYKLARQRQILDRERWLR